MPDHPDPSDPDSLADLEARLRRLNPAPPAASCERRLARLLDVRTEDRRESRLLWMRFAPLAAAACVVLAGSWILQRQLARIATAQQGAPPATTAAVPGDDRDATPVPRHFVSPPVGDTPMDRLVPVSSQQYLRHASAGAVVELSDDLPARELRLEYDDAWHWHDPATGTNLRVFQPREEVILVPVETD